MQAADAHIHLFRDGYPGKYGKLFTNGSEIRVYERIRGEHHITQALVVGYEGQSWARGNNRYISGLADRKKWIAPLAYLNCQRLPDARGLANLWRAGFKGISLYPGSAADATRLIQWDETSLASLNARRAIISLNIRPREAWRVRSLLAKLSDTTVLLSHLGLPGLFRDNSKWENGVEKVLRLAELPHVGVKLSGFYAVCPFPHEPTHPLVRRLAESYGPGRLYWGSDFSPLLDEASFGQSIAAVAEGFFDKSEKKMVFGGNLRAAIRRVATGG